MKKYKTLLVDDKEADLLRLEKLLLKHPETFTIMDKANSYDEAMLLLIKNTYDLSILDNELDKGKDFLNILNNANPKSLGLVAITSIKAHELLDKQIGLLHPLLFPKPHVDEVIIKFIHKLRKLEQLHDNQSKSKYVIKQGNDSVVILYQDIFFIEGDDEMTKFYCDGKTLEELRSKPKQQFILKGENQEQSVTKSESTFLSIPNYESLAEVEEKLQSKNFFRSHKQYIINVSRIKWHQKDGRNIKVFFLPKNEGIEKNLELHAIISRYYKNNFFKYYTLEQ